jgi:hypothetical protein
LQEEVTDENIEEHWNLNFSLSCSRVLGSRLLIFLVRGKIAPLGQLYDTSSPKPSNPSLDLSGKKSSTTPMLVVLPFSHRMNSKITAMINDLL